MKPSGASGHTYSTRPQQSAQPREAGETPRNPMFPSWLLADALHRAHTTTPTEKGPRKGEATRRPDAPWHPRTPSPFPIFRKASCSRLLREIDLLGRDRGHPVLSLPPHVAHVSSRRLSHSLEARVTTRCGCPRSALPESCQTPIVLPIPSVAVLKPRQDSGGCERVGNIAPRQSSGESGAHSEDAVVTPFAPISTARRLTVSAPAVPWIWRNLLSTWTVRRPTGCLLSSCHYRRRLARGTGTEDATSPRRRLRRPRPWPSLRCKTVRPFSAARATRIKGSPGGV
jgi:hypothetical protein